MAPLSLSVRVKAKNPRASSLKKIRAISRGYHGPGCQAGTEPGFLVVDPRANVIPLLFAPDQLRRRGNGVRTPAVFCLVYRAGSSEGIPIVPKLPQYLRRSGPVIRPIVYGLPPHVR